MIEIWDGYNEDGRLIGGEYIRGEKLPSGVFHLVCEALVRHTDGSYLLMKRDPEKESFPACFDASAGGSALKGEAPLQCIKRELFEETGLTADTLTLLGITAVKKNSCIVHSFLAAVSGDKNNITLQKGETVGFKWVTRDELKAFLDSGKDAIPTQRTRLLDKFDLV